MALAEMVARGRRRAREAEDEVAKEGETQGKRKNISRMQE